MKKYKNLDGNSSITDYQIEEHLIHVWFKGGSRSYTYSTNKAGKYHVENMKQLAMQGSGLNGYIMNHVKNLFD
ncbi:MAG: hypothetical protein QM495_06290 [Lutibacter sp.]|uniref:hypothetical protein n=1 Tax=Lutibacter sp. TaxID=1925666 RepID=UPI00385D00D3